LNDTHRSALAKLIENGPIPAIHLMVSWMCDDAEAPNIARGTQSRR
jgi:hypothetical protein